MKIRIYLSFLLLNILVVTGYSQSYKNNRVGYIANFGLATYVGELSNDFQSFTFKPNVGIGLSYRLNSFLTARGELDFFKLGGSKYTRDRSISFASNNAEISATLVYDLIPQRRAFKYRNLIAPYLFAGVGFDFYKTTVSQTGIMKEYRTINSGNYLEATPVIPIGAGVKIKTSLNTDLVLEFGYRKTFTQNLDNIRPQTGNADLTSPETTSNATPAQVKSAKMDGYFMTNVKFIYAPKFLFKKRTKPTSHVSKWQLKKNKEVSKQIAKNKKLSSYRVIRYASIE